MLAAYGLFGASGVVSRKRRVVGLERAVDLVGRDLDVAGDLRRPRRVEQALCSHDVGAQERRGVADRAVDMALGGEVHDRVEFSLGHQLHHQWPIGDIAVDEAVARVRVDAGQVVGIAGVRQRIEVRDLDRGIGLQIDSARNWRR